MIELRRAALDALRDSNPDGKSKSVRELFARLTVDQVTIDVDAAIEAVVEPGRPPRPNLVDPRDVPRRKLGSPEGHAALIHSLAHIEFNAINLALDALARFSGLPRDYYRDWMKVAAEEALHFQLLVGHLQTLGARIGDFPAHNGLWEDTRGARAGRHAGDPGQAATSR
jgi:uncharacterized ferritin-like protein (DUF455 family)